MSATPVIVGERELGERLIAWAESLTPQEKKEARDVLYRHFSLEGPEETQS